MSIIATSAIVEDAVQPDGRRYIRERHTESDGLFHDFVWMAVSGQDATAGLASRAAWLDEDLPEREILQNVANIEEDSSVQMRFRYSTVVQLAQRIRERFRTSTGEVACRMARLFLAQPDARLITVFEITQGQVDTLRPRLQVMVDKHDAMNAVEGE